MSNPDEETTPAAPGDEAATATAGTAEATEAGAEPEKHRLELEVEIKDVGPCKKHLKVVIPHAEIDRQLGDSLKTVRREAIVPVEKVRSGPGGLDHMFTNDSTNRNGRSAAASSTPVSATISLLTAR